MMDGYHTNFHESARGIPVSHGHIRFSLRLGEAISAILNEMSAVTINEVHTVLSTRS